MHSYTNQIQILHLSDIHFGQYHVCNPLDPSASRAGLKKLSELIIEDLENDTFQSEIYRYNSKENTPLILAVTGDFTQVAAHNEFESAFEFMNDFVSKQVLGRTITKEHIFMIPGNHDVVFSEQNADRRFQPYCSFYNKFFEDFSPRKQQFPHKPAGLTQIHKLNLNGNKLLIVEINCCMYVEKDTVDASRGQVDEQGIRKIAEELSVLSKEIDFNDYIKIALIHHHLVLLPTFIEPGRGVDSVVNARSLLRLLSKYDFHAILHGHKHYPQIFSYDPESAWAERKTRIPQLVIAGGSCGSNELPASLNPCNTYSLITIKWHPQACQARIHIITRGLNRQDSHGALSQYEWFWKTVNITDKVIEPYQTLPSPGNRKIEQPADNFSRKEHYNTLRNWMPVVEVMPSLIPSQAYEARVWITEHKQERNPNKKHSEPPIRVEWSAGPNFKKQICFVNDNPKFCASFHYWGPMLIQAHLVFSDGHEATTFVYARMPKKEV